MKAEEHSWLSWRTNLASVQFSQLLYFSKLLYSVCLIKLIHSVYTLLVNYNDLTVLVNYALCWLVVLWSTECCTQNDWLSSVCTWAKCALWSTQQRHQHQKCLQQPQQLHFKFGCCKHSKHTKTKCVYRHHINYNLSLGDAANTATTANTANTPRFWYNCNSINYSKQNIHSKHNTAHTANTTHIT